MKGAFLLIFLYIMLYKKITNLFFASVCGLIMLCSCATTKQNTGMASSEKKIELDECILMADGNPNRAWGEAIHGKLSEAKALAEGQARAAIARKISTAITTATNENNISWSQSSYDGNEGATVRDEGGKQESKTLQIAQMVLDNVVVMKSSPYQRPNGLYHVYVCVEQQDAPSKIANKIANKVKQQVSDEDRLKMQYQFEKFEESIQKELQKMKDDQYKQ